MILIQGRKGAWKFFILQKRKSHILLVRVAFLSYICFFLKAFYDFFLSLLYFLFPSLLFILLKLSSVLSHLLWNMVSSLSILNLSHFSCNCSQSHALSWFASKGKLNVTYFRARLILLQALAKEESFKSDQRCLLFRGLIGLSPAFLAPAGLKSFQPELFLIW